MVGVPVHSHQCFPRRHQLVPARRTGHPPRRLSRSRLDCAVLQLRHSRGCRQFHGFPLPLCPSRRHVRRRLRAPWGTLRGPRAQLVDEQISVEQNRHVISVGRRGRDRFIWHARCKQLGSRRWIRVRLAGRRLDGPLFAGTALGAGRSPRCPRDDRRLDDLQCSVGGAVAPSDALGHHAMVLVSACLQFDIDWGCVVALRPMPG
mmetsp:Transcript_64749/g.180173  ORF Transcript_64749/g.180173 Transcript_64749/m.180173 type:complete len:204 (-) Transcript_64749:190-801(-)